MEFFWKASNNEASSGNQRQLIGVGRIEPSGKIGATKVKVAPMKPVGLFRLASNRLTAAVFLRMTTKLNKYYNKNEENKFPRFSLGLEVLINNWLSMYKKIETR